MLKKLPEGRRGFVLTGLTGAARSDVPGSGDFLARLRGKVAPAAKRRLPVLAAAPACALGICRRKRARVTNARYQRRSGLGF